MPAIEPLTLDAAVLLFLETGLTGRKPDTVKWYTERLKQMAVTIGKDRPLAEITRLDLAGWYAGLQLPSKYTLHGYGRAARRFWKWLGKIGAVADDPSIALDLPRLPHTSRAGISDADLAAMLDAAANHPRDLAIMRFLEATGCRLCGVVSLTLARLDLAGRRAIVIEKFGNDRTVFLSPAAQAAMAAWLAIRPKTPGLDNVFISSYSPYHALTEDTLSDRFEKYARSAGLSCHNTSPHQWRHRYGRKLASAGINLGILSQLMGHTTPTITVEFYGLFGVDHLQEQYDRYNSQLCHAP